MIFYNLFIAQCLLKAILVQLNIAAKLMNLCDDKVRLPLVKVTDDAKIIIKKALESAKLI